MSDDKVQKFKGIPDNIAPFAAYCRGHTTEEIAQVFGIDHEKLLRRIARENWDENKKDLLAMAVAGNPTPGIARLATLQANRDKNVAAMNVLFEDFMRIAVGIRDGTFKVKKQWKGKGAGGKDAAEIIIERMEDPSIQDRLALANWLKTLTEIGYRALGDVPAGESQNTGLPSAQLSSAAITIILPEAIAKPRHLRGVEEAKQVEDAKEQPVIDITPEPSKDLE